VGESSSSSQDSVTAGFFLGLDAWGLIESLFREDARAASDQYMRQKSGDLLTSRFCHIEEDFR